MRAALFVTCLVDNFFPNTAEAMVRILAECGVEVVFPKDQTCCGQPAFNSGYIDDAKAVAATMVRALADYDYIVSPSGSCTGMVHHYYPDLFRNDLHTAEAATRVTQNSYEFTQFLVNVLKITDLNARFPHTVTYHPSCHGTRLLGVRDEPEQLLRAVRDIRLIDLPYAEDCCGFGGTFAAKMDEISTAMVTEKVQHVRETEAEVLVGTDMGCLMNIGGRMRREGQPTRVMHIAELLYEGMRLGTEVHA